MRASMVRWGVLLGLSAVALGSFGCLELFEQDSDLFVMSQMHQVTDASEAQAGFICSNLDSDGTGSSGGGDTSNDWWERQATSSRGLHVVVGSYDAVLEDRVYDTDFIRSREVDRFVVDTRDGNHYSYTVWGGASCESCPPRPFEPLPGDPWGCGESGDDGSAEPVDVGPPAIDPQ